MRIISLDTVQPHYVGSWTIGSDGILSIQVLKKPNWIHRKMTTLFFGWVWKDN